MSYFGTIYADTELPSRARAVYMYLRDRADSEGKSHSLHIIEGFRAILEVTLVSFSVLNLR